MRAHSQIMAGMTPIDMQLDNMDRGHKMRPKITTKAPDLIEGLCKERKRITCLPNSVRCGLIVHLLSGLLKKTIIQYGL